MIYLCTLFAYCTVCRNPCANFSFFFFLYGPTERERVVAILAQFLATSSLVALEPERHRPLAKRARCAPLATDAANVATAMMKADIPVQQILAVIDEADADNGLYRKLCDA